MSAVVITRTVEVTPTTDEMVDFFVSLRSDAQAEFFTALGNRLVAVCEGRHQMQYLYIGKEMAEPGAARGLEMLSDIVEFAKGGDK